MFIEALRPHQFQESVRDELIIDDTPMQNPESFRRRVLHLADQWPAIQRLIDAAADDSYRCGRGERDHVIEDAIMGHHDLSGRGHSASAGKRKITASAVREITGCRSTAGPRRVFTEGNPHASSTVSPNLSACLLYTSPSPRDGLLSRMPSSA